MAIGAEAINSVFLGLVYGSLLIIGFMVAFFIYYIVTFKHKLIVYEVSEKGTVGRSRIKKVRERKDKSGATMWSGANIKIPQPPAAYTKVCGRGSLAMCYMYEGSAIWIKPEPIVYGDKNYIHQLDLFTGSQKGSYLAVEEQAAKKRLGTMDRVMQMVNVGVLVLVLLVIVFGWSELSSTPKELAGQIAPISENFKIAADKFADTAEKLGNIEKGVQQLQDKNRLPEEPPQ